jgi:hypothetical protein
MMTHSACRFFPALFYWDQGSALSQIMPNQTCNTELLDDLAKNADPVPLLVPPINFNIDVLATLALACTNHEISPSYQFTVCQDWYPQIIRVNRILIGFSTINHPFWSIPILGIPHMHPYASFGHMTTWLPSLVSLMSMCPHLALGSTQQLDK